MGKFYISKEGYKRLKEELEFLKKVKRREIAERIQIAKDQGDISENTEYEEAKEEQAFVEGKILELEKKIKDAIVLHKKNHKNQYKIEIGSKVRLKFGKKEMEYEIVGSNEADPSEGKISNESPLGQALLGHKKGDIIQVPKPNGRKNQYKVVKVG